MDQKPTSSISQLLRDSSLDYKVFSRPLLARLLEAMELSKNYYHGEGDYLFYEEHGTIHRVLDLTGGYGANILGHRNPRLLAKLKSWHDSGAPSLTQGSLRQQSGILAKRISDSLAFETGEGPWITTFSNSGTEAVEAAMKHSLIYFRYKLVEIQQEIEKEMNQALIIIKRMEPAFQVKELKKLRSSLIDKIPELKMSKERASYLTHQLANTHDVDELVSLIREINKKQIETRPFFISLEKSYHGKTMGALSLTWNEGFRNPFYLDESNNQQTIFISQYIENTKLEDVIKSAQRDLILLAPTNSGVTIAKHTFSTIAAAFVEPIQGEAGVVPVSHNFLAILKKFSLQEDFLLVFDEIQSGIYRTGFFTAGSLSSVSADVYTFSKSLGGGIAKIAATTILQRKYIEDFGFLHTSTFSDDDFSASIALEVLDILQADNSPLVNGMQNAGYLSARLERLKLLYPEIIKEIRGQGLMLAVELNDVLPDLGFEFKIISDSKMQGYLMSSALLNHEGLRMNPSLSNNLTLRVQPSLYITITQIEELVLGLSHLCDALKASDVAYFLSAIYPKDFIHNQKAPELHTSVILGSRPLSVFLCHLIDEAHIRKVSPALRDVEGKELLQKLARTKDLAEFQIYHTQTILDDQNREMDIALLAIPITSEELKRSFVSRKRYQVVQKVQHALQYAKELGANTVGLGQFTSIVSGNGLYLDSLGMNLTTGNGYTIALTVQSALRSAKEKNIELINATVALVGAAGNIMSVASSLMADHVGKIILMHHTPVETSIKFQEATKRILGEISLSEAQSPVVQVIKRLWRPGTELLGFLKIADVMRVFCTSGDMNIIAEANIVLCGASASAGFLTLDLFKSNAVIVDIAVPPTIKPELLAKIESERPDLVYHMGGVAKMPLSQNISTFIFPLNENECYACMAETFAIGLSGKKNFLNIGDLNKKIVTEVEILAKEAGFILGKNKNKNSL